ncbi:copper amine oxidase N-terminal domain-containing protein [Cohnella laeviribosi]|uniref:copper amine oxidase N-terminal domain-containing protein n=1 Tax=Cohnella laeviribosi TaxID=380174 RepID=UPI003CCB9244
MPSADANGRTLVPLRLVGDLMGASVNWDRKEQKAIVAVEDETIVLFIGKDTALVNNQQVKLDTKPVVQNETAMVPLRFLSEVLKINIRYIKDATSSSYRMRGC